MGFSRQEYWSGGAIALLAALLTSSKGKNVDFEKETLSFSDYYKHLMCFLVHLEDYIYELSNPVMTIISAVHL